MNMYAIRGAIQIDENSAVAIKRGTGELLTALLQANSVSVADIISVLFTATVDLNAAFPAAGAREIGFGATPLICATEIDVPDSLPRTIRTLVHVHGRSEDLRHVYLGGAAVLRQDLAQ